jgi:hypothetical protein
MIDCDQLLYGNVTKEQITEYFRNGDFDQECYLIEAIKKHLVTKIDIMILNNLNLTIGDCLNGRYNGEQKIQVYAIYQKWNNKLGFKHFGS